MKEDTTFPCFPWYIIKNRFNYLKKTIHTLALSLGKDSKKRCMQDQSCTFQKCSTEGSNYQQSETPYRENSVSEPNRTPQEQAQFNY